MAEARGIAIDALWEMAHLLETDEATDQLERAYHDDQMDVGHLYNLGSLVCLAKKPAGTDTTIGDFFTPEGTRPLSIVNCDNRIVASVGNGVGDVVDVGLGRGDGDGVGDGIGGGVGGDVSRYVGPAGSQV